MGVKQLWSLLGPVGRPVLLETMEGKTMAIDSSIWIYQFQATMRDKDGRGLVNAHILGFLRRICKLLYYGIKPVFVFDGGAPALKRSTLNERRKKKSGAADSHARVAERLLAAQLRREALNHAAHAQGRKTVKVIPEDDIEVSINDDAVYLEDLEPNAPPRTPAKKSSEHVADGQGTDGPSAASSTKKNSAEKARRNKWQDHDPYKLPEIDLDAAVAQATSSAIPDPRLATEEELRAFIDDIRPEDFDVNSEAFRELPTEVQYEIIGDLRLKSRQTSHKRLQTMLRTADPACHNGNDGATGGWVLGIRDEGTQSKPIEIDAKSDSDEEGSSPRRTKSPSKVRVSRQDKDLREFQQQMALAAIAKRQSPKKNPPSRPKPQPKPSKPLFIDGDKPESDEDEWEEIAMNESLQMTAQGSPGQQDGFTAGPSRITSARNARHIPVSGMVMDDSDGDLYDLPPQNLVAPPMQVTASTTSSAGDAPPLNRVEAASLLFGLPTMLLDDDEEESTAQTAYGAPRSISAGFSVDPSSNDSDDEGSMEEVVIESTSRGESSLGNFGEDAIMQDSDSDDMEEVNPGPPVIATVPAGGKSAKAQSVVCPDSGSDDGMEVFVPAPFAVLNLKKTPIETWTPEDPSATIQPVPAVQPFRIADAPQTEMDLKGTLAHISPKSSIETASVRTSQFEEKPIVSVAKGYDLIEAPEATASSVVLSASTKRDPLRTSTLHADAPPLLNFTPCKASSVIDNNSAGDEDPVTDWSRSPTPELIAPMAGPSASVEPPKPKKAHTKDFDAADEIDINAEEGDFAAFISQVKGQDLDAARKEVDNEILALNKEKKAAMRDSEDVTQQMIGQIKVMLRLFGIPYVTAPMEAEAQCATLVQLGLVDGIITDDSDVFLFGGIRVFRNMFNQSKTVEVYLLSDLQRELGLGREKLVNLAYLLGSDYVEGLAGVGPVVAMEILKEFERGGCGEDEEAGIESLKHFREWWAKVQSGKDGEKESGTKFRKRFKKKFKDLYLPEDWPNPVVRDAYYHPAVDDSREEFKWALPDIDGLRNFLREELGWSQGKVDETLLPIVKRVGQRGQMNAINKQSNLNAFFDISAGSGTFAPKRSQAYASKRLQRVVSDFRKRKNATTTEEDEEEEMTVKKKQKRKVTATKGKGKAVERGSSVVPVVEKKVKKPAARKKRKVLEEWTDEDKEADKASNSEMDDQERAAALSLRPRPRPRPRMKGAVNSARQEPEDVPQAIEGEASGSGSATDEKAYVPDVAKGKQKRKK
ncbi:DNA repair protein rad2 [Tulasnella sp. JGI-2019a]|nr:DNA repair protein rad2 [Tulasnella sp. JGI-2019a]